MSFSTLLFFVFLLGGVLVYYLIPRKYQWIWLLILSYGYYFSFSVKTVGFLLYTTIVTFIGGLILDRINNTGKEYLAAHKKNMEHDEKKAYKAALKHRKRMAMAAVLVLDFGMLAYVKYTNFFLENLNMLMAHFGGNTISLLDLVLPLGISFYTFQSASYLIDMYQGKYSAEKNPFRFALFVSFFPQLLQGPIGRFDRLAHQLYEGHAYELKSIQYGLQRILWGLFKKMVLADRSAVFVNQVFNHYQQYGGWYNIMAVLMYSIQLYADFSGGIDIVIGSAQMFGIHMDENFRQPYFSTSIGDFWRRWHITLGTWMKDYIFYPFSLSKAMNRFGKWGKKHLGNTIGRGLPICLADLLIFLIVGIWHGAAWKYIAYGMYNGIIMAFSSMMEPVYHKTLARLHINPKGKPWHVFQIIRTFVLVNISWFFDMGLSFSAALVMMKMSVTRAHFSQFLDGSMLTIGLGWKDYILLAFGVLVVFVVSVCKEKGIVIRDALAARPLPVRWAVYYGLILAIILLGYTGSTSGFIYANF